MRRFVETGEGTLIGKTIEVQALHRSGARFPVELAINATRLGDSWEFTALLHDISERRKKAAQFENAFNYAPIGMALVGLDGRFLRVNAAFSRIVGFSVEELQERDFRSLTHPADVSLGEAEIKRLLAREIASFELDKRYVHKNGRDVWVRLCVSRVEAEDGSPQHLIAQIEDMTNEREAENRYRLMAQNATDMITTTDIKGRVTFISPACQRILGLSPSDVLNKRAFDFVHPEDLPQLQQEYAVLLQSGSAKPVRWRAQRADGEWIWLESSIGILHDGVNESPSGFIDAVRDITERKRREDALAEARMKAERAVKSKSDFVANMSHELRTPLNSIIGFSHLLTEAPELHEETRRRVKLIHSAGQALRGVIDNVLDFSKLEAAGLELDCAPFDLPGFAREAVQLMEPQAKARDVKLLALLSPDVPTWVNADSSRLRQVVLNLLSNAVKFTHDGSVTLSVWPVGDTGADLKLRFEVRDTGSGIPEDRVNSLFSRFVQAGPAIAAHYGGTGLGLAISRQLIELMNGDMGVTSKLGEGSTFWFEVPLAAATERPDGSASERPRGLADLAGKRILVVDDVDLNRDLMLATLTRYNLEVALACDGAEAVAAVCGGNFDLVLMDCQMPVMDGFAATRAIRAGDGPYAEIPIIALTASAQPAHLQRCIAAGMNDHLAKPLDERQMERALMRLLSISSPTLDAAVPAPILLTEPVQKPSLSDRYRERKEGTLARVAAVARLKIIEDGEVQELARLAHQLAGTAAMFGDAELGRLAAQLEVGLETWAPSDRTARLQSMSAQLAGAAGSDVSPLIVGAPLSC
nr:PAS domain S-box protein [Sphingomonas xinjiangensis]